MEAFLPLGDHGLVMRTASFKLRCAMAKIDVPFTVVKLVMPLPCHSSSFGGLSESKNTVRARSLLFERDLLEIESNTIHL